MYYGSKYCAKCKYNRNCFSQKTLAQENNRKLENECIIMKDIFEKEYDKVNQGE